MHTNFAPGVEMKLFKSNLTVRRTAVGVPQLPGKLIRFTPIVILVVFFGLLFPIIATYVYISDIIEAFYWYLFF